MSESLRVENIAPDHRDADFDLVAGASSLSNGTFSIPEFRRLATPLLNQSLADSCRHFVRITDETQVTKKAFKTNLLTIEDFFYKYLERDQ